MLLWREDLFLFSRTEATGDVGASVGAGLRIGPFFDGGTGRRAGEIYIPGEMWYPVPNGIDWAGIARPT